LERAIEPLFAYQETFAAFKEQNELNGDKYVSQLDDGEHPIEPEALKVDIERHRKMEDDLREKMPASVVVSMFKVNNNDPLDKYC
jgi:hypothetical protein